MLFVVAAVLIILSQFMGSPFLAPGAALVAAVILVVAAGLTNPLQAWIQWINTLLSIGGVLFFSGIALMRYQESAAATSESLILFLLVLDFVIALYFAVRTLRGVLMRGAPEID